MPPERDITDLPGHTPMGNAGQQQCNTAEGSRTCWLTPSAAELAIEPALDQWRAQGFAELGPVLNSAGLTALRTRAEDLMLGRVTYPGMFFQIDAPTGRYEDAPLGLGWQGPSLSYRKLEKLELDPLFLRWLSNSLFERIAQAALGPTVSLYRAIIFNKAAENGGSNVPWHQDGGQLWGLSRDPELQIWTALDDALAGEGCLEFLPESHHSGFATKLGGVVPSEQVIAAEAGQRAVAVPVRAGEAILVHNAVWHRSAPSVKGKRRMAFSACYLEGTTHCQRKRSTPRAFLQVFPKPAAE
jgi:phytanoyl-CoA hydroxylase